jgi:predicted AAA+ superfamily ATPase
MEKLLARPQYLDQLISFKDKKLIKVVTGIRRCGKSTLLDLFTEYLKGQGVEDRQIIHINMEDPDYDELDDYQKLYNYIKKRLCADCMNYVIIDEVQAVKEFQKAVDGLYIKKNCDVYITGSNSQILSGELATLLSGRYVEIKMLPLSFCEYVHALGDKTDLIIKYRNYLENSSFPYTLELDKKKDIRAYLSGIYDSVILNDIVARKKITDIAGLKSVTRFAFDNIGNFTSATNIANKMADGGRSKSVHTVDNYLNALTESFVLYKAYKYDIKGKEQLNNGAKYYGSDIGLRYFLLGTKKADLGHILENVVYRELIRRGYEVHVGKIGNAEVDFIAIFDRDEEYYQVAYTVEGESASGKTVLERELAPLDAIKDHNPKYLITMDFTPKVSHNGIKQINALDWLLGE